MIKFLDVNISNLSKEEILQKIKDWLNSQSFHYITTPNSEMIVDAQKDAIFKSIHNNADMTLPDTFGMVLWSKILGLPKINRIPGADMAWDVLELAQKQNKSVFLLGGKPGVAKAAAQVIEKKLSGIKIVGAENGGKLAKIKGAWDFDKNLIQKINQSCPDILLIGRGHPHQEYFMWDFRNRLPSVKLAMGIGGTFDFISGKIKRAPKFLRKLGLEWLWRLIQEPWRAARIYKALITFSILVIKNKLMFGRKKIVVRFAPSPTGFLHIGGLRTALYNWILAKQNRGVFILRLEDTDQERHVPESEIDILQSLRWAGIIPDQGLYLDDENQIKERGNCKPYRQSQRLEIYQKYAQELLEKNMAYHCFCSEERLRLMREQQQTKKQPPKYDGHCRNLSSAEVEEKLSNNLSHVIRLKVPEQGTTEFNDNIRDKVAFKNSEIDDQVLIKSDGFPTYHLANVVDDHLMDVNYVIRGEEWLSSTPKHVILYNALGWEPPQYAHLSLLLNPDRSKLSKRSGDVTVKDYREDGYLPEAIINFIATLGWNPKADTEIYDLLEIKKYFKIQDINKSGAVFNREKLDWLNNHYIRQKDLTELTQLCVPYLVKAQLITQYEADQEPVRIGKIIMLFSERMKKLSELPDQAGFFFKKMLKYDKGLLRWKDTDPAETRANLQQLIDYLEEWNEDSFISQNLEQEIKKWINDNGLENGKILWPMRVALSGQEKSPPPFDIAEILGKDETLRRLKQALDIIG
ncbi:glutamate--tRNA ligase [Patescibacteria group bacterium]|nr:glutamate--tRNA ligase [Patescibacteria group bacterium]MBU1921602.1 glutamate--tRNA ligase [Patescibacteria group bacterium]